jgi:hypothetical protein
MSGSFIECLYVRVYSTLGRMATLFLTVRSDATIGPDLQQTSAESWTTRDEAIETSGLEADGTLTHDPERLRQTHHRREQK